MTGMIKIILFLAANGFAVAQDAILRRFSV